MRILLVCCCVLLTSMAAVRAVVGETQPQIEVRVGACVDAAGRQRIYRENNGFYLVTYEQGVSTAEHRFAPLTPEQRKGELRAPCPPFPTQSRPVGEGIGLYEITFDGSGYLTTVSVVQSANSVLDAMSGAYVRKNWHGPLNTVVVLAVAYHKTETGGRVYGL